MHLREIISDDYAVLLDIKVKSIESITSVIPVYSQEEMDVWVDYVLSQSLEDSFAGYDGFIVLVEDMAVGFVYYSMTENIGNIKNLFVLPDYEGKGVGAALLSKAESALLEDGCESIHIRATLNAQGFYDKYGYVFDQFSLSAAQFKSALMNKNLI